jgi:tetratricopeptide (TPR) repeat protein
MALAHSKLGDNETAIKFISISIEMKQKIYGNEDVQILLSYINLAYFYHQLKNIKMAIDTLQGALVVCEGNKDIDDIYAAVLYKNLGQCYFSLGNEIKGLCNYSKANVIYKKFLNEKPVSISDLDIIIQNMYGIISI